MTDFKLTSNYQPIEEQQKAINKLVTGIENGMDKQVLLGVTGSGKSLDYEDIILLFESKNNKHIPKFYKIGEHLDSLFNSYEYKTDKESEILYADDIKEEYRALSINPHTGKQEIKEITAFTRHKAPENIYRVTTKCGREVTATKDHNFWVLREGKLVLCETKDIKMTDYLPIPRKLDISSTGLEGIWIDDYISKKIYFRLNELISLIKIPSEQIKKMLGMRYWHVIHHNEGVNLSSLSLLSSSFNKSMVKDLPIFFKHGKKNKLFIQLNDAFLQFLGLYIAEGHATKRYLLISAHEKVMKERLIAILDELKIVNKERSLAPGDFHIYDSILTELFSQWCGKTAGEKKLPPWFFQLNKKQMSLLISMYFDGDGYVNSQEIAATTKSIRLASDLVYALSIFGIITRIRKKWKRATNIGSKHEKQFYYELIISGQNNVKVFEKEIGFGLDRKQSKIKNILHKKENTNVDLIPLNGKDLKSLREHANLSQAEMAKMIGCSRPLLSFIEDNKRNPSKGLTIKLHAVLNELLTDKKDLEMLNFIYNITKVFWSQIKTVETISPSNKYVYDLSVKDNETFLGGMGGVYVHNTFTVANVIQKLQKPALIISHNKTLAGQLYQEFRDFFPENAVSYFVSYYDYYQPEAYIPSTDTYIEKDADINELIDKLRLAATTNLLTRKDTIVVASVSCIYNIGSPKEYGHFTFEFARGQKVNREQVIDRLIDLQYQRSDFGFHRGTFRVRGDTIDIYPAYLDEGLRIEIENQFIKQISTINTVTGEDINPSIEQFTLYPAKHFMTDPKQNEDAFLRIEKDLKAQVDHLKSLGREMEAHRLRQRVTYDMEMIKEVGYVKGIENYSQYFDGRKPGDAPFTLLDYFREPYGDDWLLFVDESHITFPQVRGMYAGDRSRKQTLIDYGFRLPSALDNRPLQFEEFVRRIPGFTAVSATPSEWELSQAKDSWQTAQNKVDSSKRDELLGKDGIVEQLVRPTGIPDPEIEIRPIKNQVADIIEEIKKIVAKGQRVLVTTLTKRTAEDLSTYLKEKEINVQYLHSDVKTLERTDILDDLRKGKYDVLVGVNLLREGLDLPEVSLVAILDADKEGFLRSEVSLIQTMGRAARHVEGKVILYADRTTNSMERAIGEVTRRRVYQIAMNKKYGITPKSIQKPIRERLVDEEMQSKYGWVDADIDVQPELLASMDTESLTPKDKRKLVVKLRKEMRLAAQELNFELAAKLRDLVKQLTGEK